MTLLHTRLAIVDLSEAGHQPMVSSCGRWALTFNGEIYNHAELRTRHGIDAPGHSDARTVVELIARLGIETAVASFNGIWALAALDTRSGALFLSRDPYGVKPLYWARSGPRFSFASRIDAVEELIGKRAEIDAAMVPTFLSLRFVPSPRTLLRGVHRVPPGTVLRVEIPGDSAPSASVIEPVGWSGTALRGDPDALRSEVESAVARQYMGDVPVSLLLSSGLDSRLLASASRAVGESPRCFVAGFPADVGASEIPAAAEHAEQLGLTSTSVETRSLDVTTIIAAVTRVLEEPLGTASVIPMWPLCSSVAEHSKVVISGQGADEVFGGYVRHQAAALAAAARGSWARTSIARLAVRAVRGELALRRWDEMQRATDDAGRMLAQYRLFDDAAVERLAGVPPDTRSYLDRVISGLPAPESEDELLRILHLDARLGMADDLLLYTDKISMAFSLEVRVPFLDLELAPRIERHRMPGAAVSAWSRKRQLRAVGSRAYGIGARGKLGFVAPIRRWFCRELGPWFRSRLLDDGAAIHDLVDREELRKSVHAYQSGVGGLDDRHAFGLVMLSVWAEQRRSQ